jgi:hypothetical protein
LEKRAGPVLSGSEGDGEKRGGPGGQRGEMAPTMYAHMNNWMKEKKDD